VTEVPLPDRLRADLRQAMRGRDRAATSALRTALAALANAEAPGFDASLHREGRGELVEHERLVLSEADERSVLEAEVARREQLLADTTGTGLEIGGTYTADLEAELAVLRRYLD
jgi:uncharacterized protein YqeY